MIPVFCLFWAVYVYVGGAYETAIDLGAENRRAALVHVVNYCPEDSQPGSAVMAEVQPQGDVGNFLGQADDLVSNIDVLAKQAPSVPWVVGTYTDQTVVQADALVDYATVDVVHGAQFVCREYYPDGRDLEVLPAAQEAWEKYGRPQWN